MASFLNQHSFALFAAACLLGLAVFLLRDGFQLADGIALAAMAGGLGLAYVLFQPGASTYTATAEVDRLVAAGRPVLLEFQSPY
jgi:hypothetical protein